MLGRGKSPPGVPIFAHTKSSSVSHGLISPSNEPSLSRLSAITALVGLSTSSISTNTVKTHHLCVTRLLNTVAVHFRIRRSPARHLRQPLSDTSKGFQFFTNKTPLKRLTRVPPQSMLAREAALRSPALGWLGAFAQPHLLRDHMSMYRCYSQHVGPPCKLLEVT